MAVMAQDILSSSRSLRRAARLLATTALTAPFLAFPATAQNLPTGASVAAGQVSIAQPSATQMTITQSSSSAVVNYGSFSIGAGHAVNIAQPSINAALLNRVTGDTPSTIAGSLTANGHVYLVNPNGIAITPSGTVNVGGGFVASTLGISDDDFMSGKRTFAGNGASSQVSNAGTIRVGRGGYAALIGGTVNNSGSIEVPLGKVALGSGERATLDFAGDGFLQVAAPTKSGGNDALIKHSGSIRADGGSVIISAATAREAARNAINLSGHVQARSISGRSGSITIGGGAGGAVNISGHLSVASRKSRHPSKGGTVTVTGRDIVLQGATINASGKASGGTVKIGGDWQGTGDLQHAETTTVDAATTIKADATASGTGGTVVVWSDKATSFAGTITARGGSAGGNGGNTEVSGKALLDYTGFADLSATNGAFGTLLLDPYNVIISGGADSNHSGFAASGNDSIINVGTLQTALAGANVTVSTGAGGAQAGDITVAAPVTWSSGTMLTLDAWHSIAINAPITIAGTGGLALVTNNGGSGGTLSFAGGVQYTGSGGSLSINAQPYTLLYSMSDLQNINSGLNGNYALAKPLDATGVAGWKPLGTDGAGTVLNSGHGFAGSFTGLGNTISNLTVDIGGASFAGLFGLSNGAISDIGLLGGTVKGYAAVGGLVGANDSGGSISQAYATGAVSGGNLAVGGLVGLNSGGSISQAYATGAVSGSYDVGGLVGFNYGGSISQAHATGGVSGDGSVGGLVGANDAGASIMHAYATGAVSGASGFQGVGGLVGLNNSGDITQAYATGTISGDGSVGGLVGINNSDGRITESHASGTVGGSVDVGGLVGFNTGSITEANATGAVTGFLGVGGLVGINAGSITQAYASGAVGGSSGLGGLIGINNSGGVISQSYASGAVSGSYELGGLVGFNDSGTSITQSYATGAVSGSVEVGGLVGANAGSITQAHATGDISGGGSVGGLVGLNNGGGISEAYASGVVSGSVDVGGLVGANDASGSITQAYATGAVSGASDSSGLGGLVGINAGNITQAHATGTVSGVGNSNGLGGLVGINNSGSITQAYATGAISGASEVGGLVGFNNSGGRISQAYASGAASAAAAVGGLVGANAGNITQAYATGAVSGSGSVGGLVGLNNSGGSIAQAYATGTVSGAFDAGGLVGFNYGGNITQAYASGAVSGALTVGGLVGANDAGGGISQAYATGAVSGSLLVGGLVGLNSGGGSISQTYATGAVSGGSSVGGLVGLNDSSGSITQTYATGAVSGSSEVGGLVGFNNSGGSIASSYFDRDTTGQTLGVGSGSLTGVTALSSMDGSAFDKASYAGFDWTVWSPPSAAMGGAPAYYPELFGVSGVVGVDYGSQTITYGDTIPSFGAPSAIYGIGYFNIWTTAPGVGSVAGVNAGAHAIEATGAAANFTPGGASRVVGIGTLTIEPAALMDPGLWADRVVFDSFNPVSLPDNARPVSGALDVVTSLGIGVFYADPRFETVFVCFGGGHGAAQSCFGANR